MSHIENIDDESPDHSEDKYSPPPPPAGPSKRRVWFWAILVLSVLAIFAAELFYGVMEGQQGPVSYLTGSGELVQLSSANQKVFAERVREDAAAIKAKAADEIFEQVDTRLDASFDQLQGGVDNYLEWYFSAPASYTRLYVGLTGELDEWTEDQIRERLMDKSGFTNDLSSFKDVYPQFQKSLVLGELQKLEVVVDEYLTHYGKELDSNHSEPEVPILDFTKIVQGPEIETEFDRVLTSANLSQTAAVGGMAVAAAQYGGVRAAANFVRQFITRTAAHGARAAVIGASSTAASAMTGPFAVGVGVLATSAAATTFVATEYIALNAQETLHRPKMEQDLREFIDLRRQEAKNAYRVASEKAVDQAFETFLAHLAELEEQAKIHKCYRIVGGANCE